MTETPVARLIVSLGIPTTVSMLITSIYNMADTYFVGTLGESAQAATGVMFTLQAIIQGIAFMLGHGGGTFISKYLAARETDKATSYISSAFFAGGAAGIVLMVFGLCFLSPMVYLLGSTDTIAPHAMDYGMWVLLGCPFVICSMILNNALRYEGRALYAMVGLTTGGLLNIFGDWLLVHKLRMGVFGAGMATAISQLISFLILLFMFTRMAQSKLRIKTVSKDWRVYLSICHVGFPSLIRQGLTSVTTGVLNNLTKPFGDAAIAAMSVVSKYSMFLMCVGLGMGQGFQPVAAFNYQAKKYKRVKQGLVFTMCFGLVFIGIISLISILWAEPIITLFQRKQEVIAVGKLALRYAAIGMMFMPFSVPVNMLYQSIQKPTVSSILSLIRSGAVTIPILLISVPLIGLTGVQIAQPCADIFAGLFSIPFIVHFLRK
ncbi:MAG: MATE family efflux transporter, partial [Oscillospiraceae bacterium]|nr:MATE family efflux transporter [Oscillospiraceae bacterium]